MKLFKHRFLALWVMAGVFAVGLAWAALASADDPPKPAGEAAKPASGAPADTAKPDVAKTDAAKPTLPPYFDPANDPDKDKKYPDPTGGNAGTLAMPSADKGDTPGEWKVPDLYDRVAHNVFSINIVWTLLAGCLVMFMQAGFALVETGLARAKNAAHTAAMNFMIYPLGCIAFWAYGFAIGWGNWYNAPVAQAWFSPHGPGTVALNEGIGISPDVKDGQPTGTYKYGLLGTKGFCLYGLDDVSIMTLFFFMMVFMDTTATIPTGAMCERWSWRSFCLYGLWVALPYCIYANWVWGGGWLAQAGVNWGLGHGAVDYAGSGVVHAMGGIIGLAGALVLGPRIGKYTSDRKPLPLPGHHMPMVVTGTFILAFGWFGFNAGSSLAGTDLRIATIVVNTMLASVTGALGAALALKLKGMKPDPSMLCNGMLAGLVAITAPCAFVDSWAAVLIGAIAGNLVVLSVFFFERMGVDDPVGAISVHGVNGVWGLISVGIFANGKYGAGWNGALKTITENGVEKANPAGVTGILFGNDGQLYAQLLDAAVVVVFGFTMAYVWFKLSNLITPLRVSREVEIEGLDGPEMGAHGYPDFTVAGHK